MCIRDRNKAADSLVNLLNATKNDIDKVAILNAIASQYKTSDPKLMNDYAVKALVLSQKINSKIGQGNAYLKSYIKKDGGYVVMADDSNLPISQRKRDRLQELLRTL